MDLTGDDRPDIYLVNGAALPGAADQKAADAFYRNNGDGVFSDATAASRLNDPRYGMGVSAGDYDGDARTDLYITNVGRNTLYRNQGDGTFSDVTEEAGVGGGGFSTGSAFADYDDDGDLDLYVARYVVWSPETDRPCTAQDGRREVPVYCRPSVYPAAQGLLYRNNGNGTFTEVTHRAGLALPGRGLGVLWSDVDEDGDPDLFVANDMGPNFLFINQGDGRFTEEGLSRGVAVGEGGRSQASMGVLCFDYDGDGRLDLACTNFSGEYLALYRSLGDGTFEDVSAGSGLVGLTAPYVGFGIGAPDVDLDGRPDLFVANGHVTEAAEQFYPGVKFAQPKLLLRNNAGHFSSWDAGPPFSTPRVGRGSAEGDWDGDGDVDLLVANWKDEPDLLRNTNPKAGRAIRVKLVGKRNRLGIGARVELQTEGSRQVQEVRSGGSYLSQNEFILTFGVGEAAAAVTVRVRWPGGEWEVWSGVSGGGLHVLREGSGGRLRAEAPEKSAHE
ncbi:MAG: CRTAC1 family protein [Actinomycetota bacterium]